MLNNDLACAISLGGSTEDACDTSVLSESTGLDWLLEATGILGFRTSFKDESFVVSVATELLVCMSSLNNSFTSPPLDSLLVSK